MTRTSGRAQRREPAEPGSVGVAAGEIGEDPVGFGEGDGVAPSAGEVAEGLGDVGLADPAGAGDDDGLVGLDEPEGGEVSDGGDGDLGV